MPLFFLSEVPLPFQKKSVAFLEVFAIYLYIYIYMHAVESITGPSLAVFKVNNWAKFGRFQSQ